jgi:hypothetical protein
MERFRAGKLVPRRVAPQSIRASTLHSDSACRAIQSPCRARTPAPIRLTARATMVARARRSPCARSAPTARIAVRVELALRDIASCDHRGFVTFSSAPPGTLVAVALAAAAGETIASGAPVISHACFFPILDGRGSCSAPRHRPPACACSPASSPRRAGVSRRQRGARGGRSTRSNARRVTRTSTPRSAMWRGKSWRSPSARLRVWGCDGEDPAPRHQLVDRLVGLTHTCLRRRVQPSFEL